MKTPKKSSVKAQAFCAKLQGSEVAKSTSWDQCLDIMNEHFSFVYDIYTKCKCEGDITIISLYKNPGEKEDLIEEFSLPNSEVFIEKDGDWEWNTISKFLVEYLMKNWKALTKGTKKKKSVKKLVTVSVDTLMQEVVNLKSAIKSATGKEKKKLIQEFNEKSLALDKILEQRAAESQAATEARKASANELKKLRNRKNALMQRIKECSNKGKDTTELSNELAGVVRKLSEATTGVKIK